MPSISRFMIVASPHLGGETQDELVHVELHADDSQGDKRRWQVDRERLMSLFDVVHPHDVACDVIVQLSAGRTVTLPGAYSAVDLVQLGFRIAPTKSVRRKPASHMDTLLRA